MQSGGRPLRVFYAFDPRRTSILLIGGDKTGNDRFYEEYVPVADDLYDEHLEELRRGGVYGGRPPALRSNEWTPFVSRVDQGVHALMSSTRRRHQGGVARGDAVARVAPGTGADPAGSGGDVEGEPTRGLQAGAAG